MDALYNDRKAAYHEAAHAVMALYNGFPVRAAAIDAIGGGDTRLAWWHQFVMRFSGVSHMILYIEFLFAGRAGEMLMRSIDDAHNGFMHDMQRAKYLRMLHCISQEEFVRIYCRVNSLISDRRELIVCVAEELLVKQKLSGREIKLMMRDFHKQYPHFEKLTHD